jgi:hypothetical protein
MDDLLRRQVLVVAAGLVVALIISVGLAALLVGPSDSFFVPLILISWTVTAVLLIATQKWKR